MFIPVPSTVDRDTTASFASIAIDGIVVKVTQTINILSISVTVTMEGMANIATVWRDITLLKQHHKMNHIPSLSAMVMVVTAFPKLRLAPEVSWFSMRMKSSSNSTKLSEFAVSDVHISVPSAEPSPKVKNVKSEGKSPSILVAAEISHQLIRLV